MSFNFTFGRFLIAGGANTLLTALVTSAGALVVHEGLAYTIGYAAGLGLSAYTSSRFVFRRALTTRRAAGMTLVNLGAYGVGYLALVTALGLGLPSQLAGFTVLVTAPLTFLGGQVVFGAAPARLRAVAVEVSPHPADA
jgi:putative flippase GtrA